MPGDGHAGCGRRSGETHWWEHQQGVPGRPHNFVHDPATLFMAFDRVAGNQGANTPGVDGLTVAGIEERVGAPVSWTICGPPSGTARSGRCR